MPPSNVIKANAKTALRNKWSQAAGIGAILLAVYCINIVLMQLIAMPLSGFVGDYTALALQILSAIVIGQFFNMPLLYGVLRWFWFTSSDADVPISEIFCYFSSGKEYLRALSLSLRIFWRTICVLLVCFLPSLIVQAVSSPTTYELLGSSMPYWASYVWALGNALTIFGIIMSVILLIRYFSAPILMINDNSITPNEALSLSVIISKKANGKTFSFLLSFAGWLLLSMLYLPVLYTAPYFLCAYAVYCRFLINNYNRSVSYGSTNDFSGYNGTL